MANIYRLGQHHCQGNFKMCGTANGKGSIGCGAGFVKYSQIKNDILSETFYELKRK